MYFRDAAMLTTSVVQWESKYVRILMAILLGMCKRPLMSAKYRLGDGMVIDEKCSHNHYFCATFNLKSHDLKIKHLRGCCCFGCHLSKNPKLTAKHTCPLLHYSSKNLVAG